MFLFLGEERNPYHRFPRENTEKTVPEGRCCTPDKEFKDDEYNNDAQFHAKVGTQSQTANLATDSSRQQRTKNPSKINSLSEEVEANNMDH